MEKLKTGQRRTEVNKLEGQNSTQSMTSPQTVPLSQYQKLEQHLQIQQAAIRQHVSNQQQLKLVINDLEQKNNQLNRNLQFFLKEYKNQVGLLKRQNESLIRQLGKKETTQKSLLEQLRMNTNKEVQIGQILSKGQKTKQNQIGKQNQLSKENQVRNRQQMFTDKRVSGNKADQICYSSEKKLKSKQKLEVTMKSRQEVLNSENTLFNCPKDNYHQTQVRHKISIPWSQSVEKAPRKNSKGINLETFKYLTRPNSHSKLESHSKNNLKEIQEKYNPQKHLLKKLAEKTGEQIKQFQQPQNLLSRIPSKFEQNLTSRKSTKLFPSTEKKIFPSTEKKTQRFTAISIKDTEVKRKVSDNPIKLGHYGPFS